MDSKYSTGLKQAETRLLKEIREGLKHGFFELKITGEIKPGNKRELIISAGKSHKFFIRPEEID